MNFSKATEFVEKAREAKKSLQIRTDDEVNDQAILDEFLDEIEKATNLFTIERLINVTREFLYYKGLII